MATLTGSTIASTYDRLLALPSGGLNGATLVALTDGNASATCALSVATTSIAISATDKLYFDDGDNTYIHEAAADRLDFVVGGDTNGFVLLESGGVTKVGIGTDAPNELLTVTGANAANWGMNVTNTDNTGHGLYVRGGGTSGTRYVAQFLDAAANARMTILDTGEVGIGTASPSDTLHVAGDCIIVAADGVADNDWALNIQNQEATDDRSFGVIIQAGSTGSDAALRVQDHDGSNTLLEVEGGGNVGIGTVEPRNMLDVVGATTTSGDARFNVQIQDTTAYDTAGAGAGITFAGIYDSDSNQTNGGYIHSPKSNTSENYSFDLAFGTRTTLTAPSEKMRILHNGNVGIGIAAPTVALHVHDGSLADTEAVLVKVTGTGNSVENEAGIGVIYNASGTGATDAPCGFLRLDETDGAAMYIWAQNDNDLQISGTVNDIGSTDGTAVGSQPSDERMKNISSDAFPYGLNAVNQLTPIKFAYKKTPSVNHLGFGAQTTQSIIPECVYNSGNCPDGYTKDLYTVDDDEVKNGEKEVGDGKGTQTPKSSEKDKLYMKYVEIVPVLVKAIQELSAKVTALENA